MPTADENCPLESAPIGQKRWTRVRKAYQSGELDRENLLFRPEVKRQRRNALADISAVSTNAQTTSQKHRFHQLVERVRELQNEIVPDFHLYQMTSGYPSFSPTSHTSAPSFGAAHPHRQSLSMSSSSTNSSQSNQRLGLSPRILERAHQIPERFWIEWQQKQMQDQLEELEYIKSNMTYSSNSSLPSNEVEEQAAETLLNSDRRNSPDAQRRKRLLFLHEAQRLAKERRTSLAQTPSSEEKASSKSIKPAASYSLDEEDEPTDSFNFDQRSEEDIDTANLKELSPEPITPVPSSPPRRVDRSRLNISLPFTYVNIRDPQSFVTCHRPVSIRPQLERVIQVSKESSTDSAEDVAKIDTEFNVTVLKRENGKGIEPLLYSRATVNRCVEFQKFRPNPSRKHLTSLKKPTSIPIPIVCQSAPLMSNTNPISSVKKVDIPDAKEADKRRSSSPSLSFKSARSRLSSFDDVEDFFALNNHVQSSSVTPSPLSVASLSRSTSSHYTSAILQSFDDHRSSHSISPDSSMTDVDHRKAALYLTSSSSNSVPALPFEDEEENNFSFTRPLFTSPEEKRKEKGNTSNLSSVSTTPSQKNPALQRDCYSRGRPRNHQQQQSKLSVTHNTSIISSRRTWKWKQNAGDLPRNVFVSDNNSSSGSEDAEDDVICSSSFSSAAAATTARTAAATSKATVAADCSSRRQRRKQTRLKKKTPHRERKEKEKKTMKKERNKKSPSPSSSIEAAQASLFQCCALNTTGVGTQPGCDPNEQARCADTNVASQQNCFSMQTSLEHRQQTSSGSSMVDEHYPMNNTSTSRKSKEQVRVFVRRRRRRRTTTRRKRPVLHSFSSDHSQETIPFQSNQMEELVSMIQEKLNSNKTKKSRHEKNIIVVNYKPVFVNSRAQQRTPPAKATPNPLPKAKLIPTDDDFSSATHYSRRRSLTTTSSDGSPLRSSRQRSPNQQSLSLDVPDVEDPLMFIEMMYQQLFTEDGHLRSGTEPTALANCVKQIVTNSRRNSISSSATHRSISSQLKQKQSNAQRPFPSSQPHHHHLTPNDQYSSAYSEEEEEEEPNTLVQSTSQPSATVKKPADLSRRSLKRLDLNTSDHSHSHLHAFLHSCDQQETVINRSKNPAFRFSMDDTDNEDLDTFSDLNSMRYNQRAMHTSPSVDEDLTQTDSRLLSSSGYQSLDHSSRVVRERKSHSENDLTQSFYSKTDQQIDCLHCCPNCLRPPTISVIPPSPPSLLTPASETTTIIQRIQQPLGLMLMKYLNFILISKNVLLLPLFMFLFRQRSANLGNSNR